MNTDVADWCLFFISYSEEGWFDYDGNSLSPIDSASLTCYAEETDEGFVWVVEGMTDQNLDYFNDYDGNYGESEYYTPWTDYYYPSEANSDQRRLQAVNLAGGNHSGWVTYLMIGAILAAIGVISFKKATLKPKHQVTVELPTVPVTEEEVDPEASPRALTTEA
jgi:hypothetical protein